ncbi:MAG: helix-turn-helix domain-containing protein [Oscillospiraceae bacterium]|nr:helix-turn-helix domain-containing protein [Oscillospiraceae bacterium]
MLLIFKVIFYENKNGESPVDEIDLQVRLVREILSARKERGMTQSELDAVCGVNQTHIARIENSKTDPQLSTILKILRPLGKTLTVVDLPLGIMRHIDKNQSGGAKPAA